jgi:hypothetical protein
MWKKAWWECRFRALVALSIGGLYSIDGVWMHGAFDWERYTRQMAGIVVPIVALLMAGSGINSQTFSGMTQGFHPSMYFLLSLPVTRRQALLTRMAAGGLMILAFVISIVGVTVAMAHWRGTDIPVAHIAGSIVFMTVGGFSFFALETFLTTFLDEIWAGMFGFTIMGGLFGLGWAIQDYGKNFQPLEFITGALWNQHGIVGWGMLAFFVGTGMAFLCASIYVVERKEY